MDMTRDVIRRTFTVVALFAMAVATFTTAVHASETTCGTTVTQDTTLSSDVGPCAGDGLLVTASDITLNLNGFRVVGATGDGDHAGIRLVGVSGVTVHNGTVTGFDAGVVIGGGSGNTVRQITAQDNINDFAGPPCDLGDGIVVADSTGNAVEHNRVVHNGPYGGITLLGDADENVVRNNDVRDNNIASPPGRTGCGNRFQDEGIRVEGPGADDNRIERNRVERSLLSGIGLHGYVCNPGPFDDGAEPPNQGTVIVLNKVSHTAGTSIAAGINILRQGPASVVCPAYGNTIEKNNSSHNQADGIFVSSNSAGNTISANTVDGNGLSGIYLSGPNFANQFTNLGPTLFDVVSPDLPPYVEGTDYRVMSGSGSGDVTATLKAIDITLAAGADAANNPQPPDTSTSGCEMSDYAAAGFEAGDIALIQRGTCTFVSKVANAHAAGASAVIMFNEGQAPGRTSHQFGAVGPQTFPVLSAEYRVGFELYQLTQAGLTTAHVATNTTNERRFVAPGANNTTLLDNRGRGNGEFDGEDANAACSSLPDEAVAWTNDWFRNWFGTVNQQCVADGGTGWGQGPGRSGDAPGRLDGGGGAHNRGLGGASV